MEVDGYTTLFYDKYAGLHNFDNPHTIKVILNDLFASDYSQLTGKEAIQEFNTFGGVYNIPQNLDETLYQVTMFITTYGTSATNIAKYTVIGVNNDLLRQFVIEKIPIPNMQFLLSLCRFHNSYHKISTSGSLMVKQIDTSTRATDIVTQVKSKTGDIIDQMVANPEFLKCQLYPYQKRSVCWMLSKETHVKSIMFNTNDEVIIGDVYYDAMRQSFTTGDDRKKIVFHGGALIDEVGLGKTVQMTALALLNPPEELSYIVKGDTTRLHSGATLVLCPNQLCGQWKREIEKMVNITNDYEVNIIQLLTKVHFDKYTYQDLLDADFVIVSYNFLDNQSYLDKWVPQVSPSKSYHKSTTFNLASVKQVFDKLGATLVSDPSLIQQKNPLINLINWHRIVVDEFHEIYTVSKYEYMKNILPTLSAKYKWCVTGTPFDKGDNCLLKMFDFVTNYCNSTGDKILSVQTIVDHMKNNFFRRNTKKSVIDEFTLPPLKESVVWLKFTQTERMMYNAYLANPNNDKFSIFLRQLCCHPKLANETRDLLSNCKTLADIEKLMVSHYEKDMLKSDIIVKYLKNRIAISEKKIKRIERKRQRRFLKKKGYTAAIQNDPDNIVVNNIDLTGIDIGELGIDNINDNIDEENDDDDKNDEPVAGKKHIIISDDNQAEILSLIGKDLAANKSMAIVHIREYIAIINNKLIDAKKIYDGKKTTFDFYKNVFDRIKKTAKTEDDIDDNKSDSSDEEDEETCAICLGEIPENDIGVTKCGHIYCYQCIKTIIPQRHECPYCKKHINDNEVFMISYERKKKVQEELKDIADKIALINEVGTKLANIIYYIKGSKDHMIIFSQWDDLLRKIGTILDDYGIKNVFCRGNVWQRDKAIRTFNSDPAMRIIMLSSESAASGTNLTKASKVLIVDPVCGTYEHRKNTEGQAIGRAHRMGQLNQVEVLRFIVRDTIEEEIYNTNITEDKKHITNVNIFESSDDSITLSQNDLNELSTSHKLSQENKTKKETKKVIVKGKKPDVKKDDSDEEIDP